MANYQHIMVPTDFSEHSAAAAARAAELARSSGARLSLLHVVDYVPPGYIRSELPADYAGEGQWLERARAYLADWAKRVGLADAQQWIESGSAKVQIIKAAKENGVDLIVLGSRGERGLGRLLGSTTNAVLQEAPCDILSVQR